MSTHPYIPLYVDDYDAATAHLTVEEDGVYSRLIRLCWRTPGCSLPNEPAWIARKIRVSADDFDRIVKPVLEEFFRVQRGRLVQKRLKAEYDDITRKKTARANAGKKGGAAKALKTGANGAGNATDLSAYTGALPEPEPEPTQKEDKLLSVTQARRFDFEDWWKLYPGAVAKPVARKAYAAARLRIGGDDPDAVMHDGLRRSLASARWNDPTHTKPNPARWLEEDRWNDSGPVVAGIAPATTISEMSPALIAARRALLEQAPETPNA